MAADAEADELVAAAAGIICSMRGADLAGWTPPLRKPEPAAREGELIWPAVARGKRSRRRSPSAGSSGGKARWGRASPASPLDYSGGSGSGSAASTSGCEDGGGGFCSLAHRPVPATKLLREEGGGGGLPLPCGLPCSCQHRVFQCVCVSFVGFVVCFIDWSRTHGSQRGRRVREQRCAEARWKRRRAGAR
ncbi:uncharacterized protein [Miscanthus floridulus]|uniref:uncharacterized protein isoform X1 n=1 Tax=Miscanthus floridulus TaxID=154761 RepID=UPI00345AAA4E